MKCAVIGRGLHACETLPHHGKYEIRAALNCAIDIWMAEWLVACDPSTYRHVTGRPLDRCLWRSDLLQRDETPPAELPKWWSWPGEWVDAAPLQPYPLTYSVETAAICLAQAGATEIHFHGCLRPSGFLKPAFAREGRQINENRDRWEDEQRCMEALKTYLATLGVGMEVF